MSFSPSINITIAAKNEAAEALRGLTSDVKAAYTEIQTSGKMTDETRVKWQEARKELVEQNKVQSTLKMSIRESHQELSLCADAFSQVGAVVGKVQTMYQQYNTAMIVANQLTGQKRELESGVAIQTKQTADLQEVYNEAVAKYGARSKEAMEIAKGLKGEQEKLGKMQDALTKTTEDLASAQQKNTMMLVGFVAQAPGFLKQILGMSDSLRMLQGVGGFGGLISGVQSAGGALSGFMGALGPVGLAIMAIGIIVTVLAAAWQGNWFGIRDTLTSVWENYLKPALEAIWGALKYLLGPIVLLYTAWTENWGGIRDILSDAVDNYIKPALNIIGEALKFLLGPIVGLYFAWTENWGGIRDIIMGAVNNYIKPAIEAIVGGFKWLIDTLGGIKKAWDDFWKGITSAAASAVDALTGHSIISDLVTGVKDQISEMKEAVKKDWAEAFLSLVGDSEEARDAMKNIWGAPISIPPPTMGGPTIPVAGETWWGKVSPESPEAYKWAADFKAAAEKYIAATEVSAANAYKLAEAYVTLGKDLPYELLRFLGGRTIFSPIIQYFGIPGEKVFPTYQYGGIVKETGLALVHKGESIGFPSMTLNINITGDVASRQTIDQITEAVNRGISQALRRLYR